MPEEQVVDAPIEGQEAGGVSDPNSQGTEGNESQPTVDMQAYEKLQQEHGQLTTNWQKIEQLANADTAFRKELERAWRGLPPTAAPKQEAEPKPQPKQQSNKEIEELRQNLKAIQESMQGQQQEALRREKFAEVQSETDAVQKRFNASPTDMNEFWKRYGEMIRNEAFDIMQRNPGVPPNKAMQAAYSKHDRNLAAEYTLLMEDRMVDYYGKKIQERNNPLRGISSPADKAGKAGAGVSPTMTDRFMSTLKKERNPERRAEMIMAYANEMGIDPSSIYRSTGG